MIFPRYVKLPKSKSFFLFGPRGVGKSTLLRSLFLPERSLTINLLLAKEEDRFSRDPDTLIGVIEALAPNVQHIIIDEVQRVPKLLDTIHFLLEEKKSTRQFILTGSSARKLRRGQANLLAGRVFTRYLHPLAFTELGSDFWLADYLAWGGLPTVWTIDPEERREYLESYTLTFLKEEIQAEQVVRNLSPFRRFLEVAAQCNGKITNYANIARDVGADPKTIKSYYEVLVDTMLGVFVEAYHTSRRKRIIRSPKFYFFDLGVTRALARQLDVKPVESTSYFGELFEHFVVTQLHILADYRNLGFRFTFILTEAGAEIDLVIERPNRPLAMVEIKSKESIQSHDLRNLMGLKSDFPESEFFCISRDAKEQVIEGIRCLPWQQGIDAILVPHEESCS